MATFPTTVGGSIIVPAVTDLASLSINGLPVGTTVYCAAAAAHFKLVVSTATVDHSTVEAVTGYDGLRWTLLINQALLDTLSADWAFAREQEMRALAECSALTRYEHIKLGHAPLGETGGAIALDANVEGGAINPGASAGYFFANTIFQTPKTSAWAIEFRAKLASPVAAFSQVGLGNTALSHLCTIATNSTIDATNYYIRIVGSSSNNVTGGTIAADGAWHNLRLTKDATNIRLYVDNVVSINSTSITNLTDEPWAPFVFYTGAATALISDVLYGYVAP